MIEFFSHFSELFIFSHLSKVRRAESLGYVVDRAATPSKWEGGNGPDFKLVELALWLEWRAICVLRDVQEGEDSWIEEGMIVLVVLYFINI
ncbi:MAG: hypothetical protein D6805_03010 [Planctomycetota bacterium]|nr:MAG: hypothetical protein D6805_03010 [Planctomycetota bacterium]